MSCRERIEGLSHAAAELSLVPVGRGDGDGNDGVGRYDLSECRSQGHALDRALRKAGEQPSGLQGRGHLLGLIDRKKNALHGILQFL
jgi:hypothetical protein